ncbi:TetR/AcrR family transcriptional regulator [Kutzneria sp. NPDC052558]|uniref:TetR/AcrR family transcriptional regulator n=1 Tax=Kutzneria sp. NPDC052558 TaxID=3364121 RepID=UPI0037C828D1
MTLREMKMERTRDLIGEVAFTLFRDKGFAATTVEEIAAAAEVGARTVYRHYPTKEMLVLSSFGKMFDTALLDLRACPEDTPVPEVLRVILDSVLQSHLDRAEPLLTAYRIAKENQPVLAHFTLTMREWQRELQRDVARRIGGRSADIVAEMAVAVTAAVFTTAFHQWFEQDGRADLRHLTRVVLELTRSGEVPAPAPLA